MAQWRMLAFIISATWRDREHSPIFLFNKFAFYSLIFLLCVILLINFFCWSYTLEPSRWWNAKDICQSSFDVFWHWWRLRKQIRLRPITVLVGHVCHLHGHTFGRYVLIRSWRTLSTNSTLLRTDAIWCLPGIRVFAVILDHRILF